MGKRAFGPLCISLAACGGGQEPAAPKTEPAAKEAFPNALEPVQASARSSRPKCEDGSCFSCGEAVCLSGFYCSVGRSGHGCAWVPSCASKVSCSCLAAMLREETSCACEEKEGGVFVTCDGAKL